MSKGGGSPAVQTSTASLPEGFEAEVLGAPNWMNGLNRPAWMSDTQPGPGEGDFKGTLPEARDFYMARQLAAAPQQGETTQQALAAQKQAAGQLQNQFLPQLMGTYNSLGNQSGAIADMATQDMRDTYARSVLPSIQQGAIQAGQLGSSRQGLAEGLTRAELEKDIAGVRANILQQGASKQLAFAPQFAQMMGLPASMLSEAGAQEDRYALEQAELPYQNLLRLAQLQQGFIPGASQTVTSKPAEQSTLNKGAQGAMAGYSATGSWWGALGGALLGMMD